MLLVAHFSTSINKIFCDCFLDRAIKIAYFPAIQENPAPSAANQIVQNKCFPYNNIPGHISEMVNVE
jgi:hypothetical protein